MTRALLGELNVFTAGMLDLHTAAHDVKRPNIVYGKRGDAPAFFLIDGYCERNLIPLRSMSKHLNDRSLIQQLGITAKNRAGMTIPTSAHSRVSEL